MDKLKPILAQKFWILVGLALILPIVGWWMATASLAKEYNDRRTALESAFQKIPPEVPSPNDKWTGELAKLNTQESQQLRTTRQILWDNQLPLLTWPANIAKSMQKVPYWGEIHSDERLLYRSSYDLEIENTWTIARPMQAGQNGIVDFSRTTIHSDDWVNSLVPPTSVQMWESEEDIWLMRALLTGVNSVNASAEDPADAFVKSIKKIELRGGSPKSATPAATAAAPTEGAPADASQGLFGGQRSGRGSTSGASFDPVEELGPEELAEGDPAAAATGTPGGATDPSAPSGALDGQAKGARKRRYIESNEQYKTRGFYMELVMDHRRVPDLLISLGNSPWAVRILRVQQVATDKGASRGGSAIVRGGAAGRGGNVSPRRGGGEDEASAGEVGASLSDPYLAEVALCGIITIYLPPAADPAAVAVPGAPADPNAPAVNGTPGPAASAAPVDPGAVPAQAGNTLPGDTGAPATPPNTPVPAAGAAAPAAGAPATPAPVPAAPVTGTPAAVPGAGAPPVGASPAVPPKP